MEFRQLSAFCAVVETGSVTAAAQRLGYAQSSVTAQVQGLETSVGAPLLERVGRSVRPTAMGHAVYERARGVLRRVEDLRGAIAEMRGGLAGEVRLGSIESAGAARVPAALAAFLQERPRVRVRFETGGTVTLCKRVAAGDLDVAVVVAPLRQGAREDVAFMPLYVERLALLVAADSPLAERGSVHLRDLAGERLMLTDAACSYNLCVRDEAARVGVRLDVALESANTATLVRAVELGMGVALLPTGQLPTLPSRTRLLPISGGRMRVPVGLVRSRHPSSPAVDALAGALAASLRQRPSRRRELPVAASA